MTARDDVGMRRGGMSVPGFGAGRGSAVYITADAVAVAGFGPGRGGAVCIATDGVGVAGLGSGVGGAIGIGADATGGGVCGGKIIPRLELGNFAGKWRFHD